MRDGSSAGVTVSGRSMPILDCVFVVWKRHRPRTCSITAVVLFASSVFSYNRDLGCELTDYTRRPRSSCRSAVLVVASSVPLAFVLDTADSRQAALLPELRGFHSAGLMPLRDLHDGMQRVISFIGAEYAIPSCVPPFVHYSTRPSSY